MHKMLEFQVVVLAGGSGSRLPDVGGSVPKCLLPVGAYPVLWYTLNSLEKLGFQEVMVLVQDEEKSEITNTLEKCPLKIKYDLFPIPSDEDWGTADSLRHINNRIVSDLIVISGDLITNLDFNVVLNMFRKHDASVVSVLFDNGPEEFIELPGPKSKSKPERDIVAIDKKTQRMMFLASASDFDEDVTIPKLILKKFNSIKLYSRLLDAHMYVMRKWVLDYLIDEEKFSTLKGELLPFIIKKQLSKPKSLETLKTSEKNVDLKKDIFTYANETGYEAKIRELSSYNDHYYGSKSAYNGDLIRCYAYLPEKKTFGVRVNTLYSFCLANLKVNVKWEEITGQQLTTRLHPTAEVKTKQIDEVTTVGDHSLISEKTSIKACFIGANCTVENKVRLTNCILMNNVNIKEGSVLQDCIIYTGATVSNGCNMTHCIVGPHHIVEEGAHGNHEMYAETTDNMITVG